MHHQSYTLTHPYSFSSLMHNRHNIRPSANVHLQRRILVPVQTTDHHRSSYHCKDALTLHAPQHITRTVVFAMSNYMTFFSPTIVLWSCSKHVSRCHEWLYGPSSWSCDVMDRLLACNGDAVKPYEGREVHEVRVVQCEQHVKTLQCVFVDGVLNCH